MNINPADTLSPATLTIESLNHEGRGVAHREDGKTIFVDGAITGEVVQYSVYRKKDSYEMAQVTKLVRESAMRVKPHCPHFGVCGGCSLQHIEPGAQIAAKQRVLEDNLAHIGKVKAASMLSPIHGPAWGYRTRARLSVRLVEKKGGVLVGFHERRNSFIADMTSCAILPPRISALIPLLREFIMKLTIRAQLPQIEVVATDAVDALVIRHMVAIPAEDEALLREFADAHPHIQWWTQSKGPDTIKPLYPLDAPELAYTLPEFNLVMPFRPSEFTQVNTDVNPILMRRAMQLLDPQPTDRIADMFCGLGNFTLPIARHARHVIGIEGSKELVARAQQNAERNGIGNTEFLTENLFEITSERLNALGHFDKMLIDPPRDGAFALVEALDGNAPARIVYVSCNPATLARDAAVLVHQKGYRLQTAGIANMFPHTAHVESIAVFERN
ncbi:23S rRNA (uracil(1939)-C(5))-methyltransferase [Sulfuriferula sp. AH1]|uniref:23S rRNA (uracil(1939)-C(5))-methyltransferase RlmD n=1 Tax=Sulfuriferula sp. AH1 TaxID=1985873 RepID=UPI000B3B1AEB|nr:23S rRNA (uracil(1939)-C(5))-methyltransferase RlmD [Sulfuriferula sp. AH1]ARU32076.1 23S rRNA (uracil(1939)-C(5))-methyltransferase [Sulfuriferula sp. AH1]